MSFVSEAMVGGNVPSHAGLAGGLGAPSMTIALATNSCNAARFQSRMIAGSCSVIWTCDSVSANYRSKDMTNVRHSLVHYIAQRVVPEGRRPCTMSLMTDPSSLASPSFVLANHQARTLTAVSSPLPSLSRKF